MYIIYIYIYILYIAMCIYSPMSFCCRGSCTVSCVLGICVADDSALCDRQLLCFRCRDGEGQVTPIFVKVVGHISFPETTYMKRHILLPSCLWPPGALGAPGCLLAPPARLLGASWVPRCPKIAENSLIGVSCHGHI